MAIIHKRVRLSRVWVLLYMSIFSIVLAGCTVTGPLKYTPSNSFPNLGKGKTKVWVGDFKNKLGLMGLNSEYIAFTYAGYDLQLDREVSVAVRDALIEELKNANFIVGRGDTIISGEIYALGMSPSPENSKYDRTTITFRIHSLTDDKLLFEQTYSPSENITQYINVPGFESWAPLTARSLRDCIVSFLNDVKNKNILATDSLNGEPLTASPATRISETSGTSGQLFVEAEPRDVNVRILNIKAPFSQGMLLKPGKYHVEISALGYDTWKTWVRLGAGENKTVRIRLNREHPMPAEELPRIWLFSMGISDFKDKNLTLKYAAADARNFYKFFRSASGAMVPKTQAVLLINEAASRRNVIRSLVRTVKQANKKDLIIIFFATHGMPDPDTGELNFIMHDTVLDNLVGSGLSHSDVNRIIQRSRASKVLFLVDACHSGGLGAGSLLARRGIQVNEVNRLIAKLSEATDGTAVLSASSSNETSMEGERWGGGVFTYYIIGGLRGRADANQDQIVTLRELFDYVYNMVPAATNGQQHPELKGQFSNDLPLLEVNP